MSLLLATLQSSHDNIGALGLIDTQYGLVYLQVDRFSSGEHSQRLCGVSSAADRIFVATSSSVCVFSIASQQEMPLFKLENEIILDEWTEEVNLKSVHASENKGRLFVGNNHFNSIDELSFQGDLLDRRFLHDIFPQLFPGKPGAGGAEKVADIRFITEAPDGSLFATVKLLQNPLLGVILNIDTGQICLENIVSPNGGIVWNDKYFIQDSKESAVLSFAMPDHGGPLKDRHWVAVPRIDIPDCIDSVQNVRGLTVVDNFVYSGVWGNGIGNQIPSRITEIDAETGRQTAGQIFFPDLTEFRQPCVFSLSPSPAGLEGLMQKDLQLFVAGIPKKPTLHDSWDTLHQKRTSRYVEELTISQQKNSPSPEKPSVILEKVRLSYKRNAISLFSSNKDHRKAKEFLALSDVSFTLYEGETVGIIGRNGAGKSTISMLISGALSPDRGKLTTVGRVQLLSIGLGFRHELTGRENVFINGSLLGLSKKEIVSNLPEIESFAELGQFMDEPVRTYSAGMRSRLGFAVATAVSPDILILDEVMSAGDAAFKEKANERMEAMRKRTKTIIIISHNAMHVKKMCSRVIWLNNGQVFMDGEPESVLWEYYVFGKNPQAWLDKNIAKNGLYHP